MAGAVLVVSGVLAAPIPAGAASTSSRLPAAATFDCPAQETYPSPGLARNTKHPEPYGAPFTGSLNGGVLKVGNGAVQAILGPADAKICGVFSLPGLTGTVTPDEFEVTDNPVPVSEGVMGLQLFGAYVELKGTISAALETTPAANGGLNISLTASFIGTLVPDVQVFQFLKIGILPLPEAICTTVAGPIQFTTGTSGKLTGQPVTGPITDGHATLVANNFVYPALDPNTTEVTGTDPEPPSGKCSSIFSTAFNASLGLPNAPGVASFTAPAGFAVDVTK